MLSGLCIQTTHKQRGQQHAHLPGRNCLSGLSAYKRASKAWPSTCCKSENLNDFGIRKILKSPRVKSLSQCLSVSHLTLVAFRKQSSFKCMAVRASKSMADNPPDPH
eukprot:1161079-Pelagomonas_calceolata.AAC.13